MSDLYYHDPREALEFLLAHGAVRYRTDGQVTHLPCSLTPWKADPIFVKEVEETTSLWTTLYHAVASDDDFLHQELEKARVADSFIEHLFQAKAKEQHAKPAVYLNRNDCMPGLTSEGKIWPKQVEMNLMASALGEASSVVWRMHRFVGQDRGWQLKENRAGENLAEALALAYKNLNLSGIILLLVPAGEVSVFDQRITEARLVEQYGLHTRRATLEELDERGEIQKGDLIFDGRKVAIAYFRTGYAPYHYPDERAWSARQKIEASTAISVPSARTQLANTKLIQLVLGRQSVLRRFALPDIADRLYKTCVGFSKLDDPFSGPQGQATTGKDWALAHPDDWVLKPHREGGGNNFFGEELVTKLQSMTTSERAAYILMEKIRQPSFDSIRMHEGEAIPCRSVTELGFFSTAYFQASSLQPEHLRTHGYLLRTKGEGVDEGLVLGGFSFLDTIAL